MLENLFPSAPFGLAIGIVWGVLAFASAVIFMLHRRVSESLSSELISRTRTWYGIVAAITIASLLGELAMIIVLGWLSYMALKEYLTAVPIRRADRRSLLIAYLLIPIQYAFIANDRFGFFTIFIPVYGFFLVAFGLILSGVTSGFVRSVGLLHWGIVLTVYNLSHLAFLLKLDPAPGQTFEGFELLLFVLIITQINDVTQYVWGKRFGKTKIAPTISPGKTWEGFLLGGLTTMAISAALAPLLTPYPLPHALMIGLILAVTGFIGDIVLSAVKRDLGLKDMGSVLPGHGGYLDRLDSLTLSAPIFLHYTRFFFGS